MTKAKEDFDLLVEMALAQGGTKDMRPLLRRSSFITISCLH